MEGLKSLRIWLAANSLAREIATVFAEVDAGVTEITIDEIEQKIRRHRPSLQRRKLTTELRSLENLGLGRVTIGRHNHPSRFSAKESIQRIGKAALGTPIEPTESGDPSMIYHRFALRPDFEVVFPLPRDLKPSEVARLTAYLQLLPFDSQDDVPEAKAD